MPELPEVETVKRAIQQTLAGSQILKIEVNNPHLRQIVPSDFGKVLTGGTFIDFRRIAKYIVLSLDNHYSILLHLGMSGTVRLSKKKPDKQKHDHIVFETTKGYMVYNDPRRFGLCLAFKTAELEKHPLLTKLGIDPFNEQLTGVFLKEKLIKKTIPIKLALLDQSIVCGIGNIYASESLYLAGILPTRLANSLTEKECDYLIEKIRLTLFQAILAGGSSLKDYRQPSGRLGYFQNKLCVYGKTGQPCPECCCHIDKTGGIQHLVLGGRSTYFCVTKQR